MSEIIGRDLEVGFAVEETRGTAQVSAEKWAKRSSASVIVKAEHTTDDNTTGVIEDSESRIVTKKWCEGTLETTAQADMIGYILYNLYGSVTSSIVSGSVYQHIFAMQQSIQHPSLSIFIKDGSVAQKVFDTGMVKTFELNATTEYMKLIADDSTSNDLPIIDGDDTTAANREFGIYVVAGATGAAYTVTIDVFGYLF